MDKAAIKNFSIWARNKLIADITYKAGLLGVTEEGIKDALPQSTPDAEFYDIGTKEPYAIHGEEIKQRKELVTAIKRKASQLDYKDAYRNVVEEVAYTWFNRLIAIRFMEVNDYMPAHIRVLSSESKNKLEPDLVTTPLDAELEFTQAETEKIMQMKNDNQVDALFRFLFIKQCNALNTYLPKLFEKTSDYTELLLNVSVTDQDGIVYHLTHDINEDDFNISNIGEDGRPTGQVEIIGWMYQYYNTEPKDEAFALLKKNVKITTERIPAATQLFTPDWIVRYMVENSVGRLWLEGHEDNNLKNEWKYYLDEAEQEADVAEQLRAIREEYKNIKPEEIKVIDPCMGSGHILVYAFDVLMQIYERYGYSQRDAAKSIVENNIFGLDIDDRAFQLAYFAIMMKARSYNRRFLTLEIEPNLCAIQESNGLQYEQDMGDFLLSEEHRETLKYLLDIFVDAKEYGSILSVEKRDYDGFLETWELTAEASLGNVVMMLWYNECNQIVPTLAKQAHIMTQKYSCVVTNPPYMSNGGMNDTLNTFVKKTYPNSKADMSTVCMEKSMQLCSSYGYVAMINIPVWMFLSSFEKMRTNLLRRTTFVTMAHMGRGVFGSDFGTTAFVFRNSSVSSYIGNYKRLFDKQGAVDNIDVKEEWFLNGKNTYFAKQDRYTQIPGMPVAYWVTDTFIDLFKNCKSLKEISKARSGAKTGKNELFIRCWWEPNFEKVSLNTASYDECLDSEYKWYPYNKGGDFCNWYGNNFLVVNFYKGGAEIKEYAEKYHCSYDLSAKDVYFKEGITWTALTISKNSFRFSPVGHLFDSNKGPMVFDDGTGIDYYLLGLFISPITQYIIGILNPTMSLQNGDMDKLPIIIDEEKKNEIISMVKENISLVKRNQEAFETSYDFMVHPFLNYKKTRIRDCYLEWEMEQKEIFAKTKQNQEAINKKLIDIYGLADELVPNVEDNEISVRLADEERDVKTFILYLVGCIFGRYALNNKGITYAGGEWKQNKYQDFLPDKDNILLMSDEEYLEEDIVNKVVGLVKIIFGEEYLEENLDYISGKVSDKPISSRERLRLYFIDNFYDEHCKLFSATGAGKRPIYWLFDSGKQNGFKALIYMHRYNADTIGNLRVDYLHRMERIYESEINRMQDTIDNSSNAREVTASTKRKEKLQKQLKECQEYDEKIGHLALSRIEIDLDDGVKVNYEKVQTANDGKKYQVLAKI